MVLLRHGLLQQPGHVFTGMIPVRQVHLQLHRVPDLQPVSIRLRHEAAVKAVTAMVTVLLSPNLVAVVHIHLHAAVVLLDHRIAEVPVLVAAAVTATEVVEAADIVKINRENIF